MTEDEILAAINRLRRELPNTERDLDAYARSRHGWYLNGWHAALLAVRREILRQRRATTPPHPDRADDGMASREE